jgi:D-alanine-D-alanine ligase
MIIQDESAILLETNTIPGMTENSLFPLAARTAGLSFPELLDKLIGLSFEKEA